MEIDERYCPNCGHGVLDWHTVCPGCNQLPWDSPAGRRIIARRRRAQWWGENVLVVGIVALASVAVACGAIAVLRSPGSAFCPMPGSDPRTREQLREIEALGTQLHAPDLSADQREIAVARLTELLNHGDRVIRSSAGGALVAACRAQLLRPGLSTEQRDIARSRLSRLLRHSDEHVRNMAAWVLEEAGD